MEKLDCVIVGAGWYGLAAAKQYHCTQPERSLAVLDSEASLGGTWADHRLYPGLKSNNLLGTYEYPDLPMDTETFGVKTNEHIPGTVVNRYLKAYAAKFGIADFIRLQTKVSVAEHQGTAEGGWVLTVVDAKQQESKLFARRLVLATGRTSDPFLPHFAGQETFGGRVFHGKQFLENRDTLQTAKAVTVFGASKSAWDAVYAYATAGVKVNWIIRPTGHGPCWMSPPFVTPLKQWIEGLANTRFLTWFSPCIWGDADGYSGIRRFLHGTTFGRGIVNTFWSILGNDVMTLMKFDAHPETAKLKPRTLPMFTGDSFSILNYETDFMELVKGEKVQIHVAEFDHLSPGKVHLSDGTEFESDAMLASTGWKHAPPMKFLPEGIEKELGLPHAPAQSAPEEDLANQQDLLEKADLEILERFPRLKDQPVWNKDYVPVTETKGIDSSDAVTPSKPLTPYMLHRFIVPPSERFLRTRDFAVVGMSGNFSNTISAHIQGLWVSAYFQGLLVKDPAAAVDDEAAMHDLRYQTVLHNRWGKWRYPTDWGNKAPSFVFDAVPYLDLLQNDLGVKPHRKGGAVAEMWSPYIARDYRTLNEEWGRAISSSKASSVSSLEAELPRKPQDNPAQSLSTTQRIVTYTEQQVSVPKVPPEDRPPPVQLFIMNIGRSHSIRSKRSDNSGHTSSKPHFSLASLRGTQQPELSKKLYKLIKSENHAINAYEAASKEGASIAGQLSEWGESTNDDALSDVSDKLGVLLAEIAEQEDLFAQGLEDSRSVLKQIRNTESSVQPSRTHKQKIQDEIQKLKYKEPESTKLVTLEQELVRAEAQSLVAEAQLTNITRQKFKEAYDIHTAAVIERAEKQILLATQARQLINLLDDTPIVPGEERPVYTNAETARQTLNDAEEGLRAWQPRHSSIISQSGQLGSNAMPGHQDEVVHAPHAHATTGTATTLSHDNSVLSDQQRVEAMERAQEEASSNAPYSDMTSTRSESPVQKASIQTLQ